jgi:hypothetical protein
MDLTNTWETHLLSDGNRVSFLTRAYPKSYPEPIESRFMHWAYDYFGDLYRMEDAGHRVMSASPAKVIRENDTRFGILWTEGPFETGPAIRDSGRSAYLNKNSITQLDALAKRPFNCDAVVCVLDGGDIALGLPRTTYRWSPYDVTKIEEGSDPNARNDRNWRRTEYVNELEALRAIAEKQTKESDTR